jgi:hypothetical protein
MIGPEDCRTCLVLAYWRFFFTGAFEAAAFFFRAGPALRQVAVSEVGSLKKEIASSLSA